jgi:hypothetical protein
MFASASAVWPSLAVISNAIPIFMKPLMHFYLQMVLNDTTSKKGIICQFLGQSIRFLSHDNRHVSKERRKLISMHPMRPEILNISHRIRKLIVLQRQRVQKVFLLLI